MSGKQNHYFNLLFNTSHDAILILENDAKIKKVNPQFFAIFGLPIEDLVGESIYKIYQKFFDISSLHDLINVILNRDSAVNNYQVDLISPSGVLLEVLINAKSYSSENENSKEILLFLKLKVDSENTIQKSLHFKAMQSKTAELDESQSFLRSILNSTHYGIASYEPIRNDNGEVVDFTIRYTNSEVPSNLGLTVDDVLGKSCREMYPGIFENGIFEKMVHSLNSGKTETYDIDIVNKGKKIWLKATIEKVKDSLTITSQNSTIEKEAALFRESVNELLNSKNKELASFTSIASHDLQEPLRKIQMFISRIFENVSEFSDQTISYLNSISTTANRMQNLINSLLSYSSMDSEVQKPVKTNLNKLLVEVLEMIDNTIDEKNAMIESDNLPSVRVVPLQFQQLFINLLGNALKYSKADISPVIKISVNSEIVEGKNFIKISFSDNGIGFDSEYKHKIFEVFQRLHGKKEFVGTGVGLAICKKIVEKHDGFITADGVPGEGSVFSVFLPEK